MKKKYIYINWFYLIGEPKEKKKSYYGRKEKKNKIKIKNKKSKKKNQIKI